MAGCVGGWLRAREFITKAPLKALRGAGTLRKQLVTARRARQPTHSLDMVVTCGRGIGCSLLSPALACCVAVAPHIPALPPSSLLVCGCGQLCAVFVGGAPFPSRVSHVLVIKAMLAYLHSPLPDIGGTSYSIVGAG